MVKKIMILFFKKHFSLWLVLLTFISSISKASQVLANHQIISQQVTVTTNEVDSLIRKITVRIEGEGKGSGVLVSKNGTTYTVLTNAHVVKNPGNYIIITPDSKCYQVGVSARQQIPNLDLAILLFSSSISYPIAKMGDSNQLKPGQVVHVGGWARGGRLQSRVFLATEGDLTEVNSQLPLGYSLTYTNLVRVGMSGGPILNRQGELIGINGLVRFASNTSNQIVSSGIAINQFLQWYSSAKLSISSPSQSAINCSPRHLN